jgi:predicted nucleic acid-binding protein
VIVVDNSVLVSAALQTDKHVLARRVASHDGNWIVPPLWQYEFTNAIATLARRGTLNELAAREALDRGRLLVGSRAVAVDQHEVLRFSLRFGISGYDAQYVALADAYGVQCVSDDLALVRRARGIAILLHDYAK